MKISTTNEYSKLLSVLVGSVDNFQWPTNDPAFDRSIQESTYTDDTIQKGPLEQEVYTQTKEDLDSFVELLDKQDISVFRPITTSPHWAYSARDILLSVGNMMIECPTPFTSRRHEAEQYSYVKDLVLANGCKWIERPEDEGIMFDAANVCKFNDKLLYLESSTGNRQGAEWLQQQVGTEFEVVVWSGVYAFAHIDSTISSLNEDTILVNSKRVADETLPKFLKDHKKIWVEDMVPRTFHRFPYASKWIGMNVLSLDPETVVVDSIQKQLIDQLQQNGFKVFNTPLRHSRTLGGGFHCITCDLERQHQ